MNWEQIQGNWREFTGSIRERWGELTNDEIAQAEGNRERLIGLIQQKYGIAKEEAASQFNDWVEKLEADTPRS